MRSVRLGDVLNLNRTRFDPDPSSEYRHIGVRSFGKGLIEYGPTLGAELSKVTYHHFPMNALLFSNIKAWEGALTVVGRGHGAFIASQRFLPYVPKSVNQIDLNYVFHYLLSDRGLHSLGKASPGSADRNRTLGRVALESIDLPLPDIEEQRAIAARLDQVVESANTFDTRRSEKDLILDLAASISAVWHSEISSYRELGSMASISRGKSLKLDVESGTGAIGQAAVRWRLLPSLLKGVDPEWAKSVPATALSFEGELLVNSTGDGTIGRAALVDASMSGHVIDSHVLRVRATNPADAEMILHYLWSTAGRAAVERLKGSTTTKQTELGIARLAKMPIPDFDPKQRERYNREFRQLLAASIQGEMVQARSNKLLRALPQAARNAEFARLLS